MNIHVHRPLLVGLQDHGGDVRVGGDKTLASLGSRCQRAQYTKDGV
ncbi:hypothetical protein VCRA2112O187_13890001 [Vibrio crassostreae]|nr:hypothetical protein VCRA2112O187_13890001 [Vibrio crassostreae]